MADFDTDLGRQAANFAALTPIDFLLRAQEVYPEHTAIIHGDLRQTWAQTAHRCQQLAAALREHGVGRVIPPFLIELMGRKSKALLLFKNRWTTIY